MEYTGINRHKFLSRTQMAQQLREKIDKWACMKVKIPVQQKKWSSDRRAAHRMVENLWQLYI
jgi:hypothetical protein